LAFTSSLRLSIAHPERRLYKKQRTYINLAESSASRHIAQNSAQLGMVLLLEDFLGLCEKDGRKDSGFQK
jgi:hypothetical protein